MRLRVLAVLLIMLLLFSSAYTLAKNTNHWENLDQIADQALQLVKSERYDHAKQMLEYFSEQFLELTVRERPFSMDELRIITTSHDIAIKAVTSASFSVEERISEVTKFRLVVDAMYSEHEPLWTELENSIMTTFSQMKATIESGNNQQFENDFTVFLNKYEMIHPSLKIDISPEKVQQIDAHVQFLNHLDYKTVNQQTRLNQINKMESDLKSLFDDISDDEADPSLIWVMISTGSFIVLTLSYVGWRKYKGDKQKRLPKKEPND